MNKVVLVGNLTKDPDYRQNGEHSTARFTVACQRKFKNDKGEYESDFIGCVAFGKTADFVNNYFKKGNKISLDGNIRTGSYTKDDGTKVYTTDVIVENVEFVQGKGAASGEAATPKAKADDGFINVPDSNADELPFN